MRHSSNKEELKHLSFSLYKQVAWCLLERGVYTSHSLIHSFDKHFLIVYSKNQLWVGSPDTEVNEMLLLIPRFCSKPDSLLLLSLCTCRPFCLTCFPFCLSHLSDFSSHQSWYSGKASQSLSHTHSSLNFIAPTLIVMTDSCGYLIYLWLSFDCKLPGGKDHVHHACHCLLAPSKAHILRCSVVSDSLWPRGL